MILNTLPFVQPIYIYCIIKVSHFYYIIPFPFVIFVCELVISTCFSGRQKSELSNHFGWRVIWWKKSIYLKEKKNKNKKQSKWINSVSMNSYTMDKWWVSSTRSINSIPFHCCVKTVFHFIFHFFLCVNGIQHTTRNKYPKVIYNVARSAWGFFYFFFRTHHV